MRTAKWLGRAGSSFANLPSSASAVLLACLPLVIVAQMVTRSFLNGSLVWADEVSRLILIWLAFLGAASALGDGQHPGISVVRDRLPAKVRRIVDVCGVLLILTFSLFVLVAGYWEFQGLRMMKLTMTGLSMGWAALAFLVAGAGMVLYSLLAVRREWAKQGVSPRRG